MKARIIEAQIDLLQHVSGLRSPPISQPSRTNMRPVLAVAQPPAACEARRLRPVTWEQLTEMMADSPRVWAASEWEALV